MEGGGRRERGKGGGREEDGGERSVSRERRRVVCRCRWERRAERRGGKARE